MEQLPQPLRLAIDLAKRSFDAFMTTASSDRGAPQVVAPMPTPGYPKTPKQARAWFNQNGVCITSWCEAHTLNRYIVTDLLRGRIKGVRGESHRAAILLGLKADPATMKLAA